MSTDTKPAPGRREWAGLALLCLPTFLVSMDFSVLYLAVPRLTADLAPSGIQQLWIVDIYGFVIAGFLVTMGTLGDRIGRKRLLLAGAAVFGVASVVAAFSVSPEMLITSRALLGVAGAAVLPSVMALIMGMFTRLKDRGRALAIWTACFMTGSTLGPLVGGVLLEFFWWGSVLLVSVPGIVLLLVFGPALLSEQRSPQAGKLDPLSVVLSLAAILPFAYGIKSLARDGWTWFPAVSLMFGVAIGMAFVQRQRRLEHPLLDLRLFGNRIFRSTVIMFFISALVGAGSLLIVTLYLQNVIGRTPLAAGLLLLVPQTLMIIASLTAPRVADRIRPAYLIAGGMVVASLGYLTFTLTDATSGATTIFIAMCVVMLGTAPLAALANHLAMGAVPPDKAGSGASIVQTATEFAIGLGIATIATIGTAVYRYTVEGALGGLPPAAANAAAESIDRAVDAATQLPAQQRDDLLSASREAFTSGLHVVGVICAVLCAGLCVLVLTAFRHAKNAHGGVEDRIGEPDRAEVVGGR
ncbi:MFS transporter [Plantactinospora soyae]|uniref:DHA2 family multidrug resistance protein-like MFS transporter n=1 Tax=Plantactinospora soyae TaxID=1544732 RepID=A0A927R1I1_9ACTN|nr:MFS transporter [Plantactinospora soyae]MBE1489748.1 DHA2 family multidrug resistance protein-like MFS transporter [Plantactinospora soyae]